MKTQRVVEEASKLVRLSRYRRGGARKVLVGVAKETGCVGERGFVGPLEGREAPQELDRAVVLAIRRRAREDGLDVGESPVLPSEGLSNADRSLVAHRF